MTIHRVPVLYEIFLKFARRAKPTIFDTQKIDIFFLLNYSQLGCFSNNWNCAPNGIRYIVKIFFKFPPTFFSTGFIAVYCPWLILTHIFRKDPICANKRSPAERTLLFAFHKRYFSSVFTITDKNNNSIPNSSLISHPQAPPPLTIVANQGSL